MKGPNGGEVATVAVVAAGSGYTIGLAEEGQPGYTPAPNLGKFRTFNEASDAAERYNAMLGLSREQAFKIAGSSMSFTSSFKKGA